MFSPVTLIKIIQIVTSPSENTTFYRKGFCFFFLQMICICQTTFFKTSTVKHKKIAFVPIKTVREIVSSETDLG